MGFQLLQHLGRPSVSERMSEMGFIECEARFLGIRGRLDMWCWTLRD